MSRAKSDAAENAVLPVIDGALAAVPIEGRVTISGYEGSELLVARLLIESGADVPYVGTACPRTPWSEADRQWLEAKGAAVKFRASLGSPTKRQPTISTASVYINQRAYGRSKSILGPFNKIATVLQQDTTIATGAGHHSVINIPGTDDWYMIYHRRPIPNEGRDHRVTCIDRMYFNEDGTIKPIEMTFKGVKEREL